MHQHLIYAPAHIDNDKVCWNKSWYIMIFVDNEDMTYMMYRGVAHTNRSVLKLIEIG